ncbi:MAG: RecX family transcriptional regulator [Fimbriimonadaceae bacterium]
MNEFRVPPGLEKPVAQALRLLRASDKFSAEVRDALLGRGHSEDVVADVLSFLNERRILDDTQTCEHAVSRMAERLGRGKERIRAELMARGAPEEIVEQALARLTDEVESRAMQRILHRSLRGSGDRQKAWRLLASRGYDAESIAAAVDRYLGALRESSDE